MAFDLYITYFLATAILVLIPGPIVTLVIANSLAKGSKTGLSTAIGATSGTAVLLTIGAVGMVWVLEFLSDSLNWIRWMGALYLIFLGIKQWRGPILQLHDLETGRKMPKTAFLHGFIVAVTNPKTILFYAAFFPQFIEPSKPTDFQLFVMSVTFVCIALVIDAGYALLAGRIRRLLMGGKRGRIRNRITGGLLILTGIGLTGFQKF